MIGGASFGLSAVLAAFSSTAEMLIDSRALLGVAVGPSRAGREGGAQMNQHDHHRPEPTAEPTRKEITLMNTPPIVSPQEWETARKELLVEEKELTRDRDALAAERRRMPWLDVEKEYEFDGAPWSSNNDMLSSVSELISASTPRECGYVIH